MEGANTLKKMLEKINEKHFCSAYVTFVKQKHIAQKCNKTLRLRQGCYLCFIAYCQIISHPQQIVQELHPLLLKIL